MPSARFVPALHSSLKSVSASTASQVLLDARAGRMGAMVHNDSSAILYLTLGPGASSPSAFTVAIPANGYYEAPPPGYEGAITGAWSAANGAARVTELY